MIICVVIHAWHYSWISLDFHAVLMLRFIASCVFQMLQKPSIIPENDAVQYMTTKILKPKAKAMFSKAVVLHRKHVPGATAGHSVFSLTAFAAAVPKVQTHVENEAKQLAYSASSLCAVLPDFKLVSPPVPDWAATSLV